MPAGGTRSQEQDLTARGLRFDRPGRYRVRLFIIGPGRLSQPGWDYCPTAEAQLDVRA